MTALVAKLRNFDKDFIEGQLLTNPEPIDTTSSSVFTNGGIFSQDIFGALSNGIDYACNCGTLSGEFNLGSKCSKCNTEVKFIGLTISREGWIDLIFPHIHPVLYRYISKIIGISTLNNILDYKGKIDLNGNIINPEMEYPYSGIGMFEFYTNFEEILKEFYERKSSKRVKEYKFIIENLENVFITKIPVINSKLRPAMLNGTEYQFDVINNFYNTLIRSYDVINNMSEMEQTELAVLNFIYRNQNAINDIFLNIINNLNSKEGEIRGSLLGNRLNFTSRCVITPLSRGYKMDEILLPYKCALELFKPVLLNKLMKLKNINIFQALKYISSNSGFNQIIYNLMNDIIKDGNVSVILNRNP